MNTANKKILIVDDDPDYLFQTAMQVENMGFEVIRAESEKEGTAILETQRPDLAIVDLMMENEDSGFILSRQIKQRYPDVPVIMATAVASETGIIFGVDTVADRQWIKADRYLEKGIRAEQLQAEIAKLI